MILVPLFGAMLQILPRQILLLAGIGGWNNVKRWLKTLRQKTASIDLSHSRCDTMGMRHNRTGYICVLRRLFTDSLSKIKHTAYRGGGGRMISMTRFKIFMAVLGAVTMFVGMIMLTILTLTF